MLGWHGLGLGQRLNVAQRATAGRGRVVAGLGAAWGVLLHQLDSVGTAWAGMAAERQQKRTLVRYQVLAPLWGGSFSRSGSRVSDIEHLSYDLTGCLVPVTYNLSTWGFWAKWCSCWAWADRNKLCHAVRQAKARRKHKM